MRGSSNRLDSSERRPGHDPYLAAEETTRQASAACGGRPAGRTLITVRRRSDRGADVTSMPHIEIRAARPEDAARLTEIAHAAKRHWGYPDGLIRLWHADLTITGDFVDANPTHCAVAGAEVLGFYALRARTAASSSSTCGWTPRT
jgi:hypothetical protein